MTVESALLAASALAPSLLLLWYFHARDVYPEPPGVVWATFGLGIVSIVPVFVIAWPLDQLAETLESPFAYGFASAFLGAAIPEELCKFFILTCFVMRHSAYDEPMDGLVYGVAASMGFATLENVLYVSDGGLPVAILRALTSVPGHAFLGAIMGHYLAEARFDPGHRRKWLTRAFVIPTVLHGLYDFPLLAAGRVDEAVAAEVLPAYLLLPLVPGVLVLEGIWTLRMIRRHRTGQLERRPAPAEPGSGPPVAIFHRAEVEPAGRLGAWTLTLIGGLLGSAGVLVTVAIVVGAATGAVAENDFAGLLLGTAILGLLPLAVGAGLFAWGIRRLNQRSPR